MGLPFVYGFSLIQITLVNKATGNITFGYFIPTGRHLVTELFFLTHLRLSNLGALQVFSLKYCLSSTSILFFMHSVVSGLFFCLSLASLGCDEETKILPRNLTITATISADGSGQVTFHATADNAVRFYYYFGTSDFDAGSFSQNGEAAYTYPTTGTYSVRVRAYSVDEYWIDRTRELTLRVDDPQLPDIGHLPPLSYDNMELVWHDEFDGEALNEDFWTHEIGNGVNGWGNNELEYYQAENTSVKNGYLTIKAQIQNIDGFHYTSSRIVTKGKKAFTYGRVDIRAQLPKGQGIWPALWMLGSNISDPGIGWPKCGEIDIMEMIGGGVGRDDKVYGTAHWDNAGTYASYGGNTTLKDGAFFNDKFHVFSIVWTEKSIIWYLDDVQYHVIDTTPAELSEFQKEFFIVFNVAVGGNWPGSPDTRTTFPQRMVVDYIRVFQPL